jgi:uncharacterized protein YcbK (DUF882 family)
VITRRTILKYGLALAATSAVPFDSIAEARELLRPERDLSFYNIHTGEKLTTAYWEKGTYLKPSLTDINHILRDYRTGDIMPIDVKLLDLLFTLQRRLETTEPIHVISGYRSPKTNQMLRQQSSGVAKGSLHLQGKAIDIRVPGISLKTLHKAAVQIKRGGVGYYPKSDFVHVDTGRVRYW